MTPLGRPLVALALIALGAAEGALGLNSQAGAEGFLQKAPVSLLEALSNVEVHLQGSHQTLAWVLVFMSVMIVVLLCLLVVSDASHRPFEVVQPGSVPQYRLGGAPAGKPVTSGAFRATGREPDRPVPAGVGGRSEGPRPVPPDRPKPAQYSAAPVTSQNAQPVTFVEEHRERRQAPLPAPPTATGWSRDEHQNEAATLSVPATGGGAGPPLLCPQLVLNAQSCFVIPVEKLMEGVGSFDVNGLSGHTLLRATVRQEEGNRRTIDVTMGTPHRSPVLASIGTPMVPGPGLEVRSARGEYHFGWLRPGPAGGYVLTANNIEVLSMFCEGEAYKLYSPGGDNAGLKLIAQADRNPDFESKGEHLQVTVFPQVDAVLVICCVLAAVLFGGGDALPALM